VAKLADGNGSPALLEPPPHPDNAITAIRTSKSRIKEPELAGSAERETSTSLSAEWIVAVPLLQVSLAGAILTAYSGGACDLPWRQTRVPRSMVEMENLEKIPSVHPLVSIAIARPERTRLRVCPGDSSALPWASGRLPNQGTYLAGSAFQGREVCPALLRVTVRRITDVTRTQITVEEQFREDAKHVPPWIHADLPH